MWIFPRALLVSHSGFTENFSFSAKYWYSDMLWLLKNCNIVHYKLIETMNRMKLMYNINTEKFWNMVISFSCICLQLILFYFILFNFEPYQIVFNTYFMLCVWWVAPKDGWRTLWGTGDWNIYCYMQPSEKDSVYVYQMTQKEINFC